MPEVNDFNTKIIEEFRANGGKVGGRFEGFPLLLMSTTGAKSGKTRVNPMAYLNRDGHVYVFASKAGAETHPDWYHNLVANPDVTVEIGTDKYPAKTEVLAGDQRSEIWEVMKSTYPAFAEYESKTGREIPVVEVLPR